MTIYSSLLFFKSTFGSCCLHKNVFYQPPVWNVKLTSRTCVTSPRGETPPAWLDPVTRGFPISWNGLPTIWTGVPANCTGFPPTIWTGFPPTIWTGFPPTTWTGFPPTIWTGFTPALNGFPPTWTGFPLSCIGTPPLLKMVGFPPIMVGFPPIMVGFPPIMVGFPPIIVGFPPMIIGFPPRMAGLPPAGFDWRSCTTDAVVMVTGGVLGFVMIRVAGLPPGVAICNRYRVLVISVWDLSGVIIHVTYPR